MSPNHVSSARSPSAACLALLVAGAALALAPAGASAQAAPHVGPQVGSFGFHGHGGIVLPAGELTGVVDPGASLGGGVSHFLTRNVGLWANTDVQFLSGTTDDVGNTFPDMRMVHVGAGAELNLFRGYELRDDPDPTPVTATFRLGAGFSSLDTEDTLDGDRPSPVAFDHTYLSFHGGATAGYQVAPRVNVFAGSTAYLMVTDREDTRVLDAHSPDADVFDTAWVIPLHAGVRLTLR